MAKAGFYAVKVGRSTGVFNTWCECESCVKGYTGAIFKKFKSYEEALAFVEGTGCETSESGLKNLSNDKKGCYTLEELNKMSYNKPCFYVDGSYNSDIHRYGYGVVLVRNGKVIFKGKGGEDDETLAEYRNIMGELKACIKAVQLAIKLNLDKIAIMYDYLGVEMWCTGEWKCKTPLTKNYSELMKSYTKKLDIEFIKVKAHSGCVYNDMVDDLAKMGSLINNME